MREPFTKASSSIYIYIVIEEFETCHEHMDCNWGVFFYNSSTI